MKTAAAPLFLLLLALQLAPARERACTFRIHVEANSRDGAVFSSAIPAQLFGHNVIIEKIPAISEQDVVAFQPYPANDGTYGVLLQLDDHGKTALDALSIEQRGRSIYVFVNGRAVTEMQVDRRVTDGKFYLQSGITREDLALMQKKWRRLDSIKK